MRDDAATLARLEADFESARKSLRHASAIAAFEKLLKSKDATCQQRAAQCIAVLTPEKLLLDKLELALRTDASAAIAALEKRGGLSAGEELALARYCMLHAAAEAAERALGRARDLDRGLKAETDGLLAKIRGGGLPRGGFYRYRGAWYALADRDRARALDRAWEGLEALRLRRLKLPFRSVSGTSSLERFTKLGADGPEALRAASVRVRKALRRDYAEVRSWLATYESQPALRSQIQEARAAAAKVQKAAIALIRRYSKLEQGQVDAYRKQLAGMHKELVALRKREATGFARVRAESAFEVRERIVGGENALAAVDRYLAKYHGEGLPAADVTAPRAASVTKKRFLPGRKQSELEDVLWLLVHHRAGLMHSVAARSAELMRHRSKLTPWELYQIEQMQTESIENYNEQAAVSLDRVERDFMLRTNAYRKTLGLRPFEIEERCNVASRKHSQEMVDLGYFGHVSPVARNRGPTDRVRLEGYGGGVGENCLAGSVDGRGAFEGWYHSPGHHRNLISAGPHLGVGATADHAMWTMVAGGADATWRNLHRDLPPSRRRVLRKLAQELAQARVQKRKSGPGKKGRRGLAQVLDDARRHLPDLMPYVGRIAFAAANDTRHRFHAVFPRLLRFLLDERVPLSERPMQVAAVAAGIEFLRHAPKLEQRRDVFAILKPLLGDTHGYAASASASERAEAVLAMRKHWEDVAQWSYRRAANAARPQVRRALPGRGDGPSLEAPLRVLTKKDRLALAKQWGGGKDSENAVERGLRWLAKVQSRDGSWRARSFVLTHPKFDAKKSGIGSSEYEIAMTGLALLAFVSAGHTKDQGKYRDEVGRGLAFLRARITDYGKFESSTGHYMYGHAIATQALCEHYATTADPDLWLAAQEAVDYLMFAQHRASGGWRYHANQQADTSVTIWVIQALNAAYKAKLDVGGFRDAMRFLDHVTTDSYFRVGYTGPHDAREDLEPVGMAGRLFLGGSRGDPRVTMPARRLLKRLPHAGNYNFYAWYYATLAMFQLGGEFWKQWHDPLLKTVLDKQDRRRNSVYGGSWPPDGRWGRGAGRIYQTALGVLILTTYYRYDRGPKARVVPFTGDLDKALAPYFAHLRSSDARGQRIAILKMVDLFGAELAGPVLRFLAREDEKIDLRRSLATLLPTLCQEQHEGMLLQKLDIKDSKIQNEIVRALSQVCTKRSVDALCAHLGHANRVVRRYAAEALGGLADPRASAALSARLGKEKDRVAQEAMRKALRQVAHRSAMATVVEDAIGANERGYLAILDALGILEGQGLGARIAKTKRDDKQVYERCLQAIRQHREAAIAPLLIELLEAGALDTRSAAHKVLLAVTGKRMGYDAKGEPGARREAQQKWQLWWLAHVEEYGGRKAEPAKRRRR